MSPKKRIMRQRSEPRPVLSGQLTVITLGSSSFSDCFIITASSNSIPISSRFNLLPIHKRNEPKEIKWVVVQCSMFNVQCSVLSQKAIINFKSLSAKTEWDLYLRNRILGGFFYIYP